MLKAKHKDSVSNPLFSSCKHADSTASKLLERSTDRQVSAARHLFAVVSGFLRLGIIILVQLSLAHSEAKLSRSQTLLIQPD